MTQVAIVTALLVVAQFMVIKNEAMTYLNQEVVQKKDMATVMKMPMFEPTKTLPVVLMHGMGDAAGNGGMKRIEKVKTQVLVCG